ncbi:MAG: energy-coupling factor ABC transporter permease [Aestuariibacter sp.]|nr:energy-coupling factor ABC transporter permease [Aestuariibacter sp.]MCP5017454.1 energy-coupling factor ABC transporter permease [Ketobacter sp.]
MHIEPGLISAVKVMGANIGAVSLLSYYGKSVITSPTQCLRSLLAAIFFSLFMQSFHLSVGPSELHFVGAMAMYLTLGFLPTLVGFAAGLLLQGVLFEPQDLPHLAVNSLSLIIPLITVHFVKRRLEWNALNWQTIIKLDAIYYSGVAVMVGFWLSLADAATPLAAWATWAASYLAIVIIEPVVTLASVRLLQRYRDSKLVQICFAVSA